MQVSGSLYRAYQDLSILGSPSFDDFAKSHKAFLNRAICIYLLGMLLMRPIISHLEKKPTMPGIALGFCYCYVFFWRPFQVPAKELAFIRGVGPNYLHILIKNDPKSESIFREVLGNEPSEDTSADQKFFPSPRVARNMAETKSVWMYGAYQQADKERPVEPRETDVVVSPYLSPDKTERFYMYGSLSALRQGRDSSE